MLDKCGLALSGKTEMLWNLYEIWSGNDLKIELFEDWQPREQWHEGGMSHFIHGGTSVSLAREE